MLSYGNRRDRGLPLGRRSPGQIFQVMCRIEVGIQRYHFQAPRMPGRGSKWGLKIKGLGSEHAFLTIPAIWIYDLLAYNPIILILL